MIMRKNRREVRKRAKSRLNIYFLWVVVSLFTYAHTLNGTKIKWLDLSACGAAVVTLVELASHCKARPCFLL